MQKAGYLYPSFLFASARGAKCVQQYQGELAPLARDYSNISVTKAFHT